MSLSILADKLIEEVNKTADGKFVLKEPQFHLFVTDPKIKFEHTRSKTIQELLYNQGYFSAPVANTVIIQKIAQGGTSQAAAMMALKKQIPQVVDDFIMPGDAPYIMSAILQNDPVLLVGPTGCGKSSLLRILHKIYLEKRNINNSIFRVPCSGNVEESNFVGHMQVREQNGAPVTNWQDGLVTKAFREGHWVVFEELDGAQPTIYFRFYSMLEDEKILVLTENEGETIAAHSETRLTATANTAGRGDDAAQYSGTNVLNEAFMNRWTIFELGYPDPEQEAKLLGKYAEDDKLGEKLVEFAKKVRSQIDKGEVFLTMSTRKLVKVAKYVPLWGLKKAFEVHLVQGRENEYKTFLSETAARVFTSDMFKK